MKSSHGSINNISKKDLRLDVLKLTKSLDDELEDQELDPNGLSPQRNDIYIEYFDRLIVLLDDEYDCTEVAHILSRIREEMLMTANSYKKLYESSVTFGIQKALAARHENENVRGMNKALQDENISLKEQNDYLLRKISILEQRSPNRRTDRQQQVTTRSRFGILRGRDTSIIRAKSPSMSPGSSPASPSIRRIRDRTKSPSRSPIRGQKSPNPLR